MSFVSLDLCTWDIPSRQESWSVWTNDISQTESHQALPYTERHHVALNSCFHSLLPWFTRRWWAEEGWTTQWDVRHSVIKAAWTFSGHKHCHEYDSEEWCDVIPQSAPSQDTHCITGKQFKSPKYKKRKTFYYRPAHGGCTQQEEGQLGRGTARKSLTPKADRNYRVQRPWCLREMESHRSSFNVWSC